MDKEAIEQALGALVALDIGITASHERLKKLQEKFEKDVVYIKNAIDRAYDAEMFFMQRGQLYKLVFKDDQQFYNLAFKDARRWCLEKLAVWGEEPDD